MMNSILVGLGGSLGALSRYQLGKLINKRKKSTFPIATFIINSTGAFLLGIVANSNCSNTVILFLADGFLGAYTTFSTFMYEGFTLFEGKKKCNAMIYILSSIIIGMIGFFIGYHLFENL